MKFNLFSLFLLSLFFLSKGQSDISSPSFPPTSTPTSNPSSPPSIEAEDGSVCFNLCSGHGTCRDYTCHCQSGYTGDDCSVTFVENEEEIIPILSAGHVNITSLNYDVFTKKYKKVLIGLSSYSCHKCIKYENEYAKIAKSLKAMNVPFGRIDSDKYGEFASKFGISELPALVYVEDKKSIVYQGVHNEPSVVSFIKKATSPPFKKLKSFDEVYGFLYPKQAEEYVTLTSAKIVGVFSDIDGSEEDEYEDFLELTKTFHKKEDLYFGLVNSKKITEELKKNKTIDRSPSILLVSSGGEGALQTLNLAELYDLNMGLKEWVYKKSIPLVGKLHAYNFPMYERLNLPMLLLFLDLSNEMKSSSPGRIVGGRSGGILNEVLISEFRILASEFEDKVVFGYIDGIDYEDQMKVLGLTGGRERLPSIAFNTKDNRRVPYPEDLPITNESLKKFIAEFLQGKLRNEKDSKEHAKRALQKITPLDLSAVPKREEKREEPFKLQVGVSEIFGDNRKGDRYMKVVTKKNFDSIVLDETKDVLLYLHTRSCEACGHFNVYLKKVAERFHDLNLLDNLVMAHMDVSKDLPPIDTNLIIGPLPLLLIFPYNKKSAPYTYYSGVGKVLPIMKWVEEYAGHKFTLPNLAHLTEEDRIAYKEQVRAREEALEKKRREENEALLEEEKKKEEFKKKFENFDPNSVVKDDKNDQEIIEDNEEVNFHSEL